jgi:hypothetical protein
LTKSSVLPFEECDTVTEVPEFGFAAVTADLRCDPVALCPSLFALLRCLEVGARAFARGLGGGGALGGGGRGRGDRRLCGSEVEV